MMDFLIHAGLQIPLYIKCSDKMSIALAIYCFTSKIATSPVSPISPVGSQTTQTLLGCALICVDRVMYENNMKFLLELITIQAHEQNYF